MTADARDAVADRRELVADVREAVLDRWEHALAERAASLQLADGFDAVRRAARQRREHDHEQRRADADIRRTHATQRAVDRFEHGLRSQASPPGASRTETDRSVVSSLERMLMVVDRTDSVADTLAEMLVVGSTIVPRAGAVTAVLMVDGGLVPAVTSAGWAGMLDAVQVERHRGPVVDAITGMTAVSSANLAADARWDLADPAGVEGHRGVFSGPIVVNGAAVGAITIYGAAGQDVHDDTVALGAMLAAQASLAVGWTLERMSHRAQSDAWERGLASRDLIGQAKGVLTARHDLDADEAFALLRHTSQRLNLKVRDLADHVVTHRQLPDPP